MDLQTSADNDWNEEIFVVLDSELAFAFSFAMDSAEKWKTLSLRKGASKLEFWIKACRTAGHDICQGLSSGLGIKGMS